MSRVLLFVQNDWNGRPPRVRTACTGGVHRRTGASRKHGAPALSTRHLTATQARLLAQADRWWLVECDNAKAGRTLIALAAVVAACKRKVPGADVVLSPTRNRIPAGRILAHGGRP